MMKVISYIGDALENVILSNIATIKYQLLTNSSYGYQPISGNDLSLAKNGDTTNWRTLISDEITNHMVISEEILKVLLDVVYVSPVINKC